MERSKAKRSYSSSNTTISGTNNNYPHYYDRPKRPFNGGSHHGRHRPAPVVDSGLPVNTCFRILCPESRMESVAGKGGAVLKALRQETGTWIAVHQLVPGDDERVIEITDVRGREPDGGISSYSKAQDALLMIHERILNWDDDSAAGAPGRILTRLIVPRSHVGCLLGKAGKIIEQMRQETNTQIRILPRDHHLPRCVSASDELVQVAGDENAVKKAVAIISSRLKENPFRDRGAFHGRLHSPEQQFFPEDDFTSYLNTGSIRGPQDGLAAGMRNSGYSVRSSGYGKYDTDANHIADHLEPFSSEEITFRILCPCDRVDRIIGEDHGLLALLRDEVGVNVKVADPVQGCDERIITITSEEDQDDVLFPAQEALLHIQTHIVDVVPDKENIVKTRLLIPSIEIEHLGERDVFLAEMCRSSNAEIRLLPTDRQPLFMSSSDELVQIVGEIRAARQALLHLTDRLRSYFFGDNLSSREPSCIPVDGHVGNMGGMEPNSPFRSSLPGDGNEETDPPPVSVQSLQAATIPWAAKDVRGDACRTLAPEENSAHEEIPSAVPSALERFSVGIVTRTTVEVAISEHAATALTRSKNKLMQISEISGAKVELVPNISGLIENMIKISGTPEQAEKAQNLLQGFILSIEQDDTPGEPQPS